MEGPVKVVSDELLLLLGRSKVGLQRDELNLHGDKFTCYISRYTVSDHCSCRREVATLTLEYNNGKASLIYWTRDDDYYDCELTLLQALTKLTDDNENDEIFNPESWLNSEICLTFSNKDDSMSYKLERNLKREDMLNIILGVAKLHYQL